MQSSRRFLPTRTASLLGLGALSLLGLANARPAAAQGYTYTTITSDDLGAPGVGVTGGSSSQAAGITNAGVVVGTVAVGPQAPGTNYLPSEAYEYDTTSGAASLLNYHSADLGSDFAAISGDGSQVLGYYNPGGNGANTYFTDSNGHISSLPDPYALTGSDPNTGFAAYGGVNSSGTTVGAYSTDGTTEQGFVRGADGTLTTFSDPNDDTGVTVANGINASGTTAGLYLSSAAYDFTGFLRSADGTFTDFTVPGATDTELLGLSDNGNLFGYYDVFDADGNFVKADNFTDIGGVLDTSVDIPGARFTDITGINDAGQISGYYGDGHGNDFGFYGNFNPVPEASSVVSFGLLLAFGLGGAVVAARRKKAPATA